LLTGAVAFGVTSVLAAFSRSAGMLIAARALLGLAGATLAPSTLSLIRNMFHDPRQRRVAIGIWISSYSAGAAIGPLIGGLLLEHFWWGSVFLVAVPVMVLLLVLGPVLLPEFRDPEAGRLDLFSAALSLVSVLAVIYGFKGIAQDGPGLLPVLSIATGIAVGVVFVKRQRTLPDPMIDLRLFRIPAFSASLAVSSLDFFVAFGSFLFIAQYLQLVMGLSPMQAGLWSVPSSAALIVGSMLTPPIARRIRPAYVMAGGLALSAAGFGLLAQVDGVSGLAVLVTGFVVFSLGLAPVATLATDMIVGTAPRERAGAAAAISETGSELGGALGTAILGSIGTAVYRRTIADAVPAGVPPEATEAARDTLGGALAVAKDLPGNVGTELLGAAREAFARAFDVTAAVSAVIVIAAAIATVIWLRHVGVGSEAEAALHTGAEKLEADEIPVARLSER
jgi:DHA2 family multidrug resistance protein-like MFS transporter